VAEEIGAETGTEETAAGIVTAATAGVIEGGTEVGTGTAAELLLLARALVWATAGTIAAAAEEETGPVPTVATAAAEEEIGKYHRILTFWFQI